MTVSLFFVTFFFIDVRDILHVLLCGRSKCWPGVSRWRLALGGVPTAEWEMRPEVHSKIACPLCLFSCCVVLWRVVVLRGEVVAVWGWPLGSWRPFELMLSPTVCHTSVAEHCRCWYSANEMDDSTSSIWCSFEYT